MSTTTSSAAITSARIQAGATCRCRATAAAAPRVLAAWRVISTASNGRTPCSEYSVSDWANRCSKSWSDILQLQAQPGEQPGQAGARAGRGEPGVLAELGRIEAGHVPQGEQGPVLRAQPAEGIAQVDAAAPVDHLGARIGIGSDAELDHVPPTIAAQDLARLVGRDRDQPGAQPLRIAQSRQLAPGDRPCLLHRVLRKVNVAADHEGDPR